MHETRLKKTIRESITGIIFIIYRIAIFLFVFSLFIPSFNPARICNLVSGNMSLLTTGTAYSSLMKGTIRAVNRGWVNQDIFKTLFASSLISCIGAAFALVSLCMSLGSLKLKRLGNILAIIGSAICISGLGGIYSSYRQILMTANLEKITPNFPFGFYIVAGFAVFVLAISALLLFLQKRPQKEDIYEMEQKYKLFLLIAPFIALTFIFSYLPLWGWRYSFFDYKAGGTLGKDNFVGMKWFTFLLQSGATRNDIVRVMKNTLAMSGLGILFSWFSMAFAIFLCEMKNLRFRRVIQTFTTIPNFISWVLVYSVAFVIFSTEGLISSIIVKSGGTAVNFLMDSSHIWLKMLAWGIWKGTGWSAIIYISAISGIDQQLYEAATVDGAGRFQRMWNVTIPGLLPTYLVLLLLQISGLLSNGLEQYLVFENPNNTGAITVLDLYVYKLGIGGGKIPISTVIGMMKSLVSVTLLFTMNKISKWIRGSSII